MPDRPNFSQEEEKVLKYWKEIDAFHKQLELSKDKPAFTFYDGTPFATGMPHYGHIAAGTIKVSACQVFSQPSNTPICHAKLISDRPAINFEVKTRLINSLIL